MSPKFSKWILVILVVVTLILISAPIAVISQSEAPMKVAMVLIGTVEDKGWNFEQGRGLEFVVDGLGEGTQSQLVENISPTDVERVLRQLATEGWNPIYSTSFGFMDPTVNVAAEFPDTVFVHNSGYKTAENLSTVFAKMHEVRYLTGIVAGMATKTDIIGCVAAFDLPLVKLELNAFALGVQRVNPRATVKVVLTGEWFNPQKERDAAEALIATGADVLCKYEDSPTVEQVAQEHYAEGVRAVGFHSDTSFVGDAVLVSARWNWGPVYLRIAESVRDGTFSTESYWGGLSDGVIGLTSFSADVPQGAKDLVSLYGDWFVSGTWYPMTGPLYEQSGTLRVDDGVRMTDAEMATMDWFVRGVEASEQ